jgi:phage-related holin
VQQTLADIKYFVWQTLAYPPIKTTAAAVGGLLSASLVPHVEMLLGLAVMFALDWFFGVWNAWRTHRLSSAGMRRGITKATVYAGFIAATALVEYLTTGTKYLTAGVISIALLTELMSISEHAVALGINFGGASRIREWSRAKLALYGVIYEDAVAEESPECKNARELLVKQAPTVNDPRLREATEIYIQEWYHWMCSLKATDLDGDIHTAMSRMRHEIHYVTFNINNNMLKAGLEPGFVRTLLTQWLGDLVSRMETRARFIIGNSGDMTPALRCRAVRSVVLYHLDRFMFGIRNLEAAAGGVTPGSLLPTIRPLSDESDIIRVKEFEPTDLPTSAIGPELAGTTTEKILARFKHLNETTKTPLPTAQRVDDPNRSGNYPPVK